MRVRAIGIGAAVSLGYLLAARLGFHFAFVAEQVTTVWAPTGIAIAALLLAPLGPSGDRQYRTASFDLDADQPIQQEPRTAAEDAILIVDGTFLQRPELQNHWDITVFVRNSAEVADDRYLVVRRRRPASAQSAGQRWSK